MFVLFWSTTAHGEPHKEGLIMTCGPAKPLIESLNNRFEQKIIWAGVTHKTDGGLPYTLYLYYNSSDENWTVVMFDPTGMKACVIVSGNGATTMMQ